jgi:hypothetical protein
MSDKDRNTTSGRDPETKRARKPSAWKPIYDEFRLSTPVDWRCPCGTLLAGSKSCPRCGKVPMDHVATPKPKDIRMRQWRKFGKQC